MTKVYGPPFALWIISLGGISLALAADGGADWIGWLGLGSIPLALIAALRRSATKRNLRQRPDKSANFRDHPDT